jgi:hypothetical protein
LQRDPRERQEDEWEGDRAGRIQRPDQEASQPDAQRHLEHNRRQGNPIALIDHEDCIGDGDPHRFEHKCCRKRRREHLGDDALREPVQAAGLGNG